MKRGEYIFNTSISFIDSEGTVSYGEWGYEILYRGKMIGFQADDNDLSYGWQLDGSFVDRNTGAVTYGLAYPGYDEEETK